MRSPSEYGHGHIPGAICIPLFSDAERASVGTLYKQQGRALAIEQGLQFVGPKMKDFVTRVKQQLISEKASVAKVHCWRGGMRSSSFAWLLNTAGIATATLNGGYKSFRRYVLNLLSPISHRLIVLGGFTGSGKSALLKQLKDLGEQVLDLEQLANHRGSSFGHLNMPPQPSNEQLENEIAYLLLSYSPEKPIWIEDESRMIGRCKIPNALYDKMQNATLVFIDSPLDERLNRLHREYGKLQPEALITATKSLHKRLGGHRTQEAIALIEQGLLKEAIAITLDYYDSAYQYCLSKKRRKMHKVALKNGALELIQIKDICLKSSTT